MHSAAHMAVQLVLPMWPLVHALMDTHYWMTATHVPVSCTAQVDVSPLVCGYTHVAVETADNMILHVTNNDNKMWSEQVIP